MEFIIILNTEKYRKNEVVSKYDVRANSGPFFQSTTLFPTVNSQIHKQGWRGREGIAKRNLPKLSSI